MLEANIAILRLHSQRLECSNFKTANQVVTWLGALQGQDYAGAKLSVGLRLPGSTEADIEQAIADKAILRTWALRGALHFVAPEDIRWMVALVAPRLIAGNARRYRELELDEPTLVRSNDVLAKALQDGGQLTRKELFAILQANGVSTQGQRGVYMLQRASLDGLICQGVMRRNDPTFVALDDSVPKGKSLSRAEALAELAQRYFISRSPATLQDFVWWSGLPMSEARAGLDAVKSQLVEEVIAGQSYWLSADSPVIESSPTFHLLPGFDEYLLSYRDRSASLDPTHAYDVMPGGNGMFFSTIVADGRVLGTWKRTFKKNTVVITANPFDSLTAAESLAFAAAAQRYGDYLGMPAVFAG